MRWEGSRKQCHSLALSKGGNAQTPDNLPHTHIQGFGLVPLVLEWLCVGGSGERHCGKRSPGVITHSEPLVQWVSMLLLRDEDEGMRAWG